MAKAEGKEQRTHVTSACAAANLNKIVNIKKHLFQLNTYEAPFTFYFPELGDDQPAYNPLIDAVYLPEFKNQNDAVTGLLFEFSHRLFTDTRIKCYMRIVAAITYELLSKLSTYTTKKLPIPPLEFPEADDIPSASLLPFHTLLTFLHNSTIEVEELFSLFFTCNYMRGFKRTEGWSPKNADQLEVKALQNLKERFPHFPSTYERLHRVHERIGDEFILWPAIYALNTPIPEVSFTSSDSPQKFGQMCEKIMDAYGHFPFSPNKRLDAILTAIENSPFVGISHFSQEEFLMLLKKGLPLFKAMDITCSGLHRRNCFVSNQMDISENGLYRWMAEFCQLICKEITDTYDLLNSCQGLSDPLTRFLIEAQTRMPAFIFGPHYSNYTRKGFPVKYLTEETVALHFMESLRQQIFTGEGLHCLFEDLPCEEECSFKPVLRGIWQNTYPTSSTWQKPACI